MLQPPTGLQDIVFQWERGGLEQSQIGAEAVMETIFWLQPHRRPGLPWLPSIICKCLSTVSVVLTRSDVHQIASTYDMLLQCLHGGDDHTLHVDAEH